MNDQPNFFSLVSTDYGVGFHDPARGELRLPFGLVVIPTAHPRIEPASQQQVRTFWRRCAFVKEQQIEYYDSHFCTGD